jgi:SAM-dependent methyltransferase
LAGVSVDLEKRRSFYGATLHVRSYDSRGPVSVGQVEGDIEFYLSLAQRGAGSVLEIGVGTGRVALKLVEAGISVTGLDASSTMLAIASNKASAAGHGERLRLVCDDMRAFDLSPTRFGLIIAPGRAFQLLLTPEDQLAALGAFHRHLEPDGILALHLFDPDFRLLLPGAPPPIDRQIGVDRETGLPVEGILQSAECDYVNQRRRELWRYRLFAKDGSVALEEVLELALRWTYRWEMRHLLHLAGFEFEAEFSDFLRSPAAYGKEQIWVARR